MLSDPDMVGLSDCSNCDRVGLYCYTMREDDVCRECLLAMAEAVKSREDANS